MGVSSSMPKGNNHSRSLHLLKGSTGNEWLSSVLTYEYLPDGRVIFGQYKHEDITTKLLPLHESTDSVQSSYLYRTRLHPNQKNSETLLHHEFLVIKTVNWYYSLEKNAYGIILQRGRQLEDVLLNIMNDKRDVNPDDYEKLCVFGRFFFQKIIQWIEISGQVKKKYHILESNCQIFAEKFRKEFCFNYCGLTSFFSKVVNYIFGSFIQPLSTRRILSDGRANLETSLGHSRRPKHQ